MQEHNDHGIARQQLASLGTLLIAAALVAFLAITATARTARADTAPYGMSAQAASNSGNASSPNELCWEVVTSANEGISNSLYGVAAVSANDVWAVGGYSNGGPRQTLVEHWNGTEWSVVPSPSQAGGSILRGVAAVSANDVWAVGSVIEHWNGTGWSVVPDPDVLGGLYALAAVSANDVWAVGDYDNGGTTQTLVEHWNGTEWSVVPSPNRGGRYNSLRGVTAVSANDVWAVGVGDDAGGMPQTLVERWNGTEWSIVPSPNPGLGNSLGGVAAVSANDVWAVGYYYGTGWLRTLVEHWDGTEWSVVPSPNPVSGYGNLLGGVAAVSANDVWAVGVYWDGTRSYTLVEHWDGTAWTVVPSPSRGTYSYSLSAAAAVSGNDVWAVGSYRTPSEEWTLAEHWDGTEWTVVPSPNPPSRSDNELVGVAAVSANDVWAVGHYTDFGVFFTLVEHWNGTEWSVVPSPYLWASSSLHGVAAVSANDVWAVGQYDSHTLVEHWNGMEWEFVPSPNQGTSRNYLLGVAVVSSNDVWAVGEYYEGGLPRTLAEHWDGTQWTVVPSPNPGSNSSSLYGVAAVATNDVWAVGGYSNGGRGQTLVEHWNGYEWEYVPSPSPGMFGSQLSGVAAVSASDVWAVGHYGNEFSESYTLVEHWNGTEWSVVPSPGPEPGNSFTTLYGADAVSAHDVWAVGYSYWLDTLHTLVVHWDGTEWSVVPSPISGTTDSRLLGVDAASANDVWVVGYYGGDYPLSNPTTLIGHFSPCPPETPTPTVTRSPTATNTPLLTATPTGSATATSTPTGTPCALSFSDVNPPDYFYEAVMYLACHGVISGYSEGTFRPYDDTTRGQLSKIVVLAREWPIVIPTGTPTFRDVSPDNPFYGYVETAYSQGVISGYTCGTGCLEFHPFSSATRGQLARVIVLAMNWELTPPQQPTFQDVPLDHPFFGYIETAYAHQIISGYSCGTNCLQFRPYDNATRGQIAKIVYRALSNP